MSFALRIYFDGHCSLCAREMNQLRQLDLAKKLDLQDILAGDFSQRISRWFGRDDTAVCDERCRPRS